MDDDLLAAQAASPNPTWEAMLKRGARRHCPRCGGGHVFDGYFRMKERCPTCGYKFEREQGFFVGAYLINFAITEGLLFILMMVFIAILNADNEANQAPILAVGIALAILGPTLFYPFARTIWSAIDLGMTPLELPEIVAANDHVHALHGEPADGP